MPKAKPARINTYRNGNVGGQQIRLYMFATTKNFKSILESKTIRLSLPSRTNDKTECVLQGDEKQFPDASKMGYVCFSSTCDSAAMWGYYAEAGKGVCLVFDLEVTEATVDGGLLIADRDGFVEQDNIIILYPVEYKKTRAKKDGKGHYDMSECLFTKSSDWQHENEYRALMNLTFMEPHIYEKEPLKVGYDEPSLFSSLRAVIMGGNSELGEHEIRALLSENQVLHGIEIVQAKLSPKNFSYDVDLSQLGICECPVFDFDYSKFSWSWHTVPIFFIKDFFYLNLEAKNAVISTDPCTNRRYMIAISKPYKDKPLNYCLFINEQNKWLYKSNIVPDFLVDTYRKIIENICLKEMQASNHKHCLSMRCNEIGRPIGVNFLPEFLAEVTPQK